VLVRGEAMLGVRLYKDGAALSDRYLLTLHLEYASALEDDIQLIVLVGLLPIRLRGDEHVDADFEADGLVDDLVATAGLTEPFFDGCDFKCVHDARTYFTRTVRCSTSSSPIVFIDPAQA
jgi:hypothetical protein